MNTLATHPLLDRLAEVVGRTLFDSLWQGAAIAFLAAGLLTIIDRRRANLRYLVSCLALLTLAAWIGASASAHWRSIEFHPPVPAGAIEPAKPGTATPPVPASESPMAPGGLGHSIGWPHVVALAWAAGAIFCLVRLPLQWRALRKLRLASVPVADPVIVNIFAATCDRLKIRRKIALRVSDRIDSPLLAGFFWPVVILPAALLHGIPAPYLQAIFAHELTHFRRWDYPEKP